MQPVTKKHIIAGLILLIVILALFTFLARKWFAVPPAPIDYRTLYVNTKLRLTESEKAIVKLKDTMFGLQTEKGFLEVQLNQARRGFDEKKTDYSKAKEAKDTSKAIQICDSIVYNVVPIYMALDSSRQVAQINIDRITDTLLTITEKSSVSKDTIIAAANNEIRRLKKTKRKLWVALGAAAAVVIAWLVK